jgi:molecular chaperone GrpE
MMADEKQQTEDAAEQTEKSTEIPVELVTSEEPEEPAPDAEHESGQPEEEQPEPEAPDWEDRYLRLAAEFDNFKKRSAREYANIIKNAEEGLILELTEVLDNLERGLDPENRNGGLDEFIKGIDLIYGQFRSVLEKRGLSRIVAIGQPFDPEKHEAMMQIESDEYAEGIVAGEIAPGYILGDKVIRHSKVMVSKGPAVEEDE